MSFTLNYTGDEINAILARANNGGEIDEELALKAPLASPALTGTPTAPTQAEGDDSTKIATTEYADRAADAAGAAAEAAAKEYTDKATSALYITDTASGSIASFSDGADGIPMRSVKASIEPVQDLHGQASPYPENGGKNKLPLTVANLKAINTRGTWSGNAYSYNGMTFNVNTDNAGNVTGIKVSGTASGSSALFLYKDTIANCKALFGASTEYKLNGSINGGGSTTYYLRVAQGGPYAVLATCYDSTTDKTFNTSSFSDSALEAQVLFAVDSGNSPSGTFYPMLRLSTESDATFAPYSNICPISGYTGAEITRTGKSLLKNTAGSVTRNGLTFTVNSDKSITVSGTATANTSIDIVPLSALGAAIPSQCFLSGCPSGGANGRYALILYPTINGSYSGGSKYDVGSGISVDFTGYDGYYCVFQVWSGQTVNFTVYPQLELGSTATAYEAYNGTTYSIDWTDEAGTVYGGSINATEGDLKDNKGRADLGGLNWSLSSSGYFYAYFPNPDPTVIPMCEILKGTTEADVITTHSTNALIALTSSGNVIAYAPQYATAADFKTAMTGYYFLWQRKVANIVSYSVEPTEVTTLLGDNNIWSNTGDISVKYRANTALYIEKRLGE